VRRDVGRLPGQDRGQPRPVAAEGEAAQYADAEGAAELAGEVVDGGADASLVGGRADMIAPVAGGMVSPIPTPSKPRPTSATQIGEAVPTVARTRSRPRKLLGRRPARAGIRTGR
jgi:hypothetical protein